MATTPELSDLQKLELKEAFDEFDKVRQIKKFDDVLTNLYSNKFAKSSCHLKLQYLFIHDSVIFLNRIVVEL